MRTLSADVHEKPSAARSKPIVDGRRLRSMRTKQRIIEGFLALLLEGNANPSVAEIAKQVGCAVRSIYERFVTVKELHEAAAEYAMVQAIALAPLSQADADRPARIKAQVQTRARTCERTLRLWRLLVSSRNTSPALQDKMMTARTMITKRLEVMYQPELGTLSTDEQRKLLITLEALTDFESWGLMREHHALSFEDACDIWIGAIDRLLPTAPNVSHRTHS